MPLTTDMAAISSLKVGAAGDEYACTRFSRTVKVVGPDQTSAVAYRHEKWTATCHQVAADLASVAAAWETVRTTFCTRGERVTHATWATGLRVLPESGAPADDEERSIAGYPIVEIAEVADQSYGTWLTFTVQAESMIPIVQDGEDEVLVEHDYTITETEDEDGLITLTRRGTVRVVNGELAREWLDTELIDEERTAAGEDGLSFSVRYTQGMDAALVEYEYTLADKSLGTGGGVTESQKDDRTAKDARGRIVRTVSGYAVGPGATTFAEAAEPASSATLIRTRRDISAPSEPEGRVTFSYELLTGVVSEDFPDILIFGFAESVAEVEGGRSAQVQEYMDEDPSIRMGGNRAYVYAQESTIEFIGSWDNHGLTPIGGDLTADLYARPPRFGKINSGEHGLRRVRGSFLYISPTALELPDPREIDAFV